MEEVTSKLFNIICGALVIQLVIIGVNAVEYNETSEGYPQTFMPICPGVNKPAKIKPESLDKIKISVFSGAPLPHVFTKWTSYNHHNIKALAKNPNINFRRKTIIYCPGYLETTSAAAGRVLLNMYQKLGYNVLILDLIAFTTNVFPRVPRLMRPVGRHAAELLANLTTVGLNPKKLELIGLSLGGVSMTFIAKSFQEITGRNISKLTALDPTGPCIRQLGPKDRLDPSDADFVLHIATNTGGYGIGTPVGHVTVYVNGGEYQPAFVPTYMCDNLCSHVYAFLIWVSALESPGKFFMVQCDSVQQAKDHNCFDRQPMVSSTLDMHTNISQSGIYYLATSFRYPYYLGKKGLKRSGAEVLNHISELNAVDVLRV